MRYQGPKFSLTQAMLKIKVAFYWLLSSPVTSRSVVACYRSKEVLVLVMRSRSSSGKLGVRVHERHPASTFKLGIRPVGTRNYSVYVTIGNSCYVLIEAVTTCSPASFFADGLVIDSLFQVLSVGCFLCLLGSS